MRMKASLLSRFTRYLAYHDYTGDDSILLYLFCEREMKRAIRLIIHFRGMLSVFYFIVYQDLMG